MLFRVRHREGKAAAAGENGSPNAADSIFSRHCDLRTVRNLYLGRDGAMVGTFLKWLSHGDLRLNFRGLGAGTVAKRHVLSRHGRIQLLRCALPGHKGPIGLFVAHNRDIPADVSSAKFFLR
jgi:hypothetical protein